MKCAVCGRPVILYANKYDHVLTLEEADRYMEDSEFIDGHKLVVDFTDEYRKIGNVVEEYIRGRGMMDVSILDSGFLSDVMKECRRMALFDYLPDSRKRKASVRREQIETAVRNDERFVLSEIGERFMIGHSMMVRWTVFIRLRHPYSRLEIE
jgi:hypothetical protein